jgi:hypothetical protein
MNKVWIVWLGDSETALLIGVYATAASATKKLEEMQKANEGRGLEHYVTEEGVKE